MIDKLYADMLHKYSSLSDANHSLEKTADFELKYEPTENKSDNIFQAPKVEMKQDDTQKKPVERKVTHHKGKSMPEFSHEMKTNSPYIEN